MRVDIFVEINNETHNVVADINGDAELDNLCIYILNADGSLGTEIWEDLDQNVQEKIEEKVYEVYYELLSDPDTYT